MFGCWGIFMSFIYYGISKKIFINLIRKLRWNFSFIRRFIKLWKFWSQGFKSINEGNSYFLEGGLSLPTDFPSSHICWSWLYSWQIPPFRWVVKIFPFPHHMPEVGKSGQNQQFSRFLSNYARFYGFETIWRPEVDAFYWGPLIFSHLPKLFPHLTPNITQNIANLPIFSLICLFLSNFRG